MLINLLFRRNIGKLEDSQLLDLVRKDHKEAIGELFQRYSFLVNGLCLKYLKNRQEAEDMTMALFEKLPEKIVKNEINNFKSWLYSVARNECLMLLRKKKLATDDIEKALISEEDESETALILSELKEAQLTALEKAIDELKTEQKQCIQLFYLKKKCYEEVATETGFDLKKVKSYIQNGKRNLKLILEQKSEFK